MFGRARLLFIVTNCPLQFPAPPKRLLFVNDPACVQHSIIPRIITVELMQWYIALQEILTKSGRKINQQLIFIKKKKRKRGFYVVF